MKKPRYERRWATALAPFLGDVDRIAGQPNRGGSLREIWGGLINITLKKGLKMIGFSPPVFVMFKQTLLMILIWILAKIPTVGDAGKEF